MTQSTTDFQHILEQARQRYAHPVQQAACLPDEQILAYVEGELADGEARAVAEHVHACERCRIVATKMEVDRLRWERRLQAAYDGEAALLRAAAEPTYALPDWGMLVAEYYAEPEEARVANTARSQTFEDSRAFATEFGDITLHYSWGDQGGENGAFLWLNWEADLAPDAHFAIRILDADHDAVRFEIPPDTIADADEATFTAKELGFDLLTTPWDLAVSLFRSAAS